VGFDGKIRLVGNRRVLRHVEAAMTTETITGPAVGDTGADTDVEPPGQGAVGEAPRLLTPGEVARLFRVDVRTVTRWANAGRLTSIRTLGDRRRFREDEVLALLHATT
jgi:excisionase family DNA binding protein